MKVEELTIVRPLSYLGRLGKHRFCLQRPDLTRRHLHLARRKRQVSTGSPLCFHSGGLDATYSIEKERARETELGSKRQLHDSPCARSGRPIVGFPRRTDFGRALFSGTQGGGGSQWLVAGGWRLLLFCFFFLWRTTGLPRWRRSGERLRATARARVAVVGLVAILVR